MEVVTYTNLVYQDLFTILEPHLESDEIDIARSRFLELKPVIKGIEIDGLYRYTQKEV